MTRTKLASATWWARRLLNSARHGGFGKVLADLIASVRLDEAMHCKREVNAETFSQEDAVARLDARIAMHRKDRRR